MFPKRRTTGSVVCPSCGSLVGVRDDKCYSCGRSNPGLWGYGPLLRKIGAEFGFIQVVVGGSTLMYVGFFELVGRSTWWMGALLGALQAVFTATVLVNELLPVVHPRMATTNTSANEYALIEPPGFLMRNYGERTAVASLLAHVAYGAIVGGFAAQLT